MTALAAQPPSCAVPLLWAATAAGLCYAALPLLWATAAACHSPSRLPTAAALDLGHRQCVALRECAESPGLVPGLVLGEGAETPGLGPGLVLGDRR